MLLEECFLLDTVAALGKNDLLMTEVISERLFWHTSGGGICECIIPWSCKVNNRRETLVMRSGKDT